MLLKYTLFSKYSNCTKEEILKKFKSSAKPIKYTYGLKYRGPSTYMVDIDKEKALKVFNRGMCDLEEKDKYWDLNEYSSNDLY